MLVNWFGLYLYNKELGLARMLMGCIDLLPNQPNWLARLNSCRKKAWAVNLFNVAKFGEKPYSQATRETVAKLSIQSWKNFKIGPFNSQLSLHVKWVTKTPRKHVFSHKNNLKNFEKYGWYKSHPKANKKNKNLFGLIHIWLSIHTSHLNMYNHTNEIGIHWTLNLCVVCVDQVWNSP